MSQYSIIAIERQYASGGDAIGRLVAKELGIPCYGREILEMAAERNGQTAEYIEHLEETVSNSMVSSLRALYKIARGETDIIPEEEKLMMSESEIIRELAKEGACVFVGRSAGCILADREDVLKVFIYADDEYRIKRAQEGYGDSPEQAAVNLRKFDKRRANFYNVNFNLDWENREGYQLCLDSGKLGEETCARVLLELMK